MKNTRKVACLLLFTLTSTTQLIGCSAYSPTAAGRYEQKAIAQLASSPIDATKYEKMDFPTADLNVKKTYLINNLVSEINGKKSYYTALSLPQKEQPYSLEIGSKVLSGGVLKGNLYAFRPVVTFLDENFNVSHTEDEHLIFIEDRGFTGTVFRAILNIYPEYKYIVIHSDAKYYGKIFDALSENTQTGTNSTIAAPISGGGFAIMEAGGRGDVNANTYPYGEIYLHY